MYKEKEVKRVKISSAVILALKGQFEHRLTDSYVGLRNALLAIIQTHHIGLKEARKVCKEVGHYIDDRTLHIWIRPIPDQIQFSTSANNNKVKPVELQTDASDLVKGFVKQEVDFIDKIIEGADIK